MKTFALCLGAVLALVGCGAADLESSIPTKEEVAAASGKGDTADLDRMCEDLGQPASCDPCFELGYYDDNACDDFCPGYDPACVPASYQIQVATAEGLGVRMRLIYQAVKDSFGCTDLTMDGLSPKRIPEQYEEELAGESIRNDAGEPATQFVFDHDYGDSCDSEIRHIYLVPEDAYGMLPLWATLSFVQGEASDDQVQEVECTESNGMLNCGNDLLRFTPAGRASVKLIFR